MLSSYPTLDPNTNIALILHEVFRHTEIQSPSMHKDIFPYTALLLHTFISHIQPSHPYTNFCFILSFSFTYTAAFLSIDSTATQIGRKDFVNSKFSGNNFITSELFIKTPNNFQIYRNISKEGTILYYAIGV